MTPVLVDLNQGEHAPVPGAESDVIHQFALDSVTRDVKIM